VPQPSDDPNDPLVRPGPCPIASETKSYSAHSAQNWPLWRRDLILGILSLVSVIATTASPLLAASTLVVARHFDQNPSATAILTGYHLCGVAVAGLLFVASARVWGKRHLFLLGTVLMIISSAWGGGSGGNYTSLIWARIFQGTALAPFEALLSAVVGDLYFVHESGKRMAVSSIALFGGAFLTPVVVGKVTHDLGWEWTFYLIAIIIGLMLPLVILFTPETAFRRLDTLRPNIDQDNGERATLASSSLSSHADSTSTGETVVDRKPAASTTNELIEPGQQLPPRVPYLKTLLPFNGRKTDESFFKLLLRPLPLFLHPAIVWACLIQGVIIGWTVMIGVVVAVIFFFPPLLFNEVQTGYLYGGAFVGSLFGFLISGIMSDPVNKALIKWNHGKFEPEFRIVLVLPMLVLSSIGLYGFGITASNVEKYGWLAPDIFFAFVVAGMVVAAVASSLYIVDAHRSIAIEAFTCLLIFKNIFSFILTLYVFDWIGPDSGEVRRVFLIIATIQLVICLLSVPMYIFGKKNRSFTHRHDILKITRLK
jgi:MFS family permease